MSELKYLPVTDELFPLLGKVYAQAWKGANSFFSTPGYLKKQTPERKALSPLKCLRCCAIIVRN